MSDDKWKDDLHALREKFAPEQSYSSGSDDMFGCWITAIAVGALVGVPLVFGFKGVMFLLWLIFQPILFVLKLLGGT